MPRQVYGKKSRAIYDPFAVFGSPQRSSPTNDVNEIRTRDVAEVLTKLTIDETKKTKVKDGNRNALREKAVNIVSRSTKSEEDDAIKRRRARRKIIIDDEDDESEENTPILRSPTVYGGVEHEQEIVFVNENDIRDPASVDKDDTALPVGDNVNGSTGGDAEDGASDGDAPDIIPNERKDILHETQTTLQPSSPSPSDEYTDHCAQLLNLAHHPMTPFSDWSTQLSTHFTITKIAEASFGEVYRLSLLEQLSGFSSSDESVFKIIALKPPSCLPTDKQRLETLEAMSGPDDVANEVRLLQRMSVIPGFTNFRDVRIVQGRPPAPFAKAYKAYNTAQKLRKKESSHFPDPGTKASYAEDQLWAVIEMQDAGTDLECLVEGRECTSIWSVWDVFWQVVLSLAKGEEGAEFEHRDLHLGNICVRQPPRSSGKEGEEVDTKRKLNFTGLEATIIDYTISRALMQDGTTAYQDLARDAGLFEGDSTEEYQYDIYRYMRGAVLANNPYTDPPFPSPGFEDRSWDQYHAVTNLVWLHFVLYKLLEEVERPSECKAPPRKQKVEYMRWKRANDLEHVLFRVQELLYPGSLCENDDGLNSASDLVGLALRECWLDVDDVVGEGGADDDVQSRLTERWEEFTLDDDIVSNEPAQAKPRTRKKR